MDILERLRCRADDSENQELDREAIEEIVSLRAAGLSLIQHDNGGRCIEHRGVPCREIEKCGCYIEFQQIVDELKADK